MLGNDDGEEGAAEGVGFALEFAEIVTAPVGVMGGKDNEATVDEPGAAKNRAGTNESGWGTWGALDTRKINLLRPLWGN